jgi:hypothetical protein
MAGPPNGLPVQPDVDRALSQTAMLMKSYDVAGNSAWYWAK